MDLPLSCDCGSFRGKILNASPNTGTRITCYCSDCQAFEEFLGQSDTALDRQGGADVYQTLPHRFKIEAGSEHLAWVKVTDGRLIRWYASCCNTPIGSTVTTPDLPVVGIVTKIALNAGEAEANSAMGPSRGVIYTAEAWSEPEAKKANMLALIVTFMGRVFGAKLAGKTKDTPFFTPGKQPVVQPKVLTPEERQAIDERLAARKTAAAA